jgi:hypothetical protein
VKSFARWLSALAVQLCRLLLPRCFDVEVDLVVVAG